MVILAEPADWVDRPQSANGETSARADRAPVDRVAGTADPAAHRAREMRQHNFRVAAWIVVAIGCLTAALICVPVGWSAKEVLVDDDPVVIADRGLDKRFDAATAHREIESALAANDADLANSFLELAKDRHVEVAPDQAQRVETAVTDANSATGKAESFAMGFVTGEPNDLPGLAGTAFGDLFVFGDIRDAAREGSRLATGQEADKLILGLACVGLAITAGTYATVGAAAPARIGLTVLKAARKTGRIGVRLAGWIRRSLSEIVDVAAMRRAFTNVSITEPAIAVRAAREAVKTEKAGGLVDLVSNVGRVQSKAGTQAALEGLKIAEGPRDVARVATLAAAKGGKTRAIVKLLGRGAIILTAGTFGLASWIFGALLTLFGLVSSMKGAAERATIRHLQRRKARRLAEKERHFAMMAQRV